MALYALTISLSSFLLFQVQPLIARSILPWFGGTAAVWTTCMLFFQTLLLAGYLYAFLTVRYLTPQRQALLHIFCLTLSLLTLPILPNPAWKPPGSDSIPVLRILGTLTATVGAPYLLLSATSPLLQAWYARSRHGHLPYRLFALSNAASLAALVSYPFLFEPTFSLRSQQLLWSGGFALFAVCCGATSFRSRFGDEIPGGLTLRGVAVTDPLLWVALPATSTSLLLAVTSHLTQNVAAFPFLWLLPLALYLLSFIFCFESDRWYRRGIWYPLGAAGLAAMTIGYLSSAATPNLRVLLPTFSLGLFASFMLCHGELAALKPHPRSLTSFYVLTSLGGALGGIFVGVVAPQLFSDYHELPATLCAAALLAAGTLFRRPPRIPPEQARSFQLAAMICAAALTLFLPVKARENRWGAIRSGRNFYGVLKVTESTDTGGEKTRTLVHGVINHGQQFLGGKFRKRPVSYYGAGSGVGLAAESLRDRGALRIGVVGLGVGTMAAYGRRGDTLTFYEINPLVLDIARNDFSYLAESPAAPKVTLGDARLSLEREQPNSYDLLAIDAFSGDSIPVHLLTREALALYFRHLKDDGILAVHITNKYLDLEPVLAEGIRSIGMEGILIRTQANPEEKELGCTWVLAGNERIVGRFVGAQGKELVAPPRFAAWTDDYSNLFGVVK